MTGKTAKILPFVLLLTLAGSFFGFVDDRFRGWSDTHQYQIEAKAWKRGNRPPVKNLLLDPNNPASSGPTHVAPLVPFLWSSFVDLTSPHATIHRISMLQAFFLAWSFVAFVLVVGGGSVTFDALTIAVILFFHGLVRSWVYMPMSEPQSLALLLTSYLFSRFSGLGAAFQIVTRPPVAILQLPQLFRNRRSLLVLTSFLITTATSVLAFQGLAKPSSFHNLGWGVEKSLETLTQFREESSWIFKRLLPYQKAWFQLLWGFTLGTLFVGAVLKAGRKKSWIWLITGSYSAAILLATGEGFRYLFPATIFLLVELKPQWPKSLWVKVPVIILVVHLCVQQAEALKDLRNDRWPESDSPGLVAARNWIQEHYSGDSVIMMFRYRFCVNYFDTPCVPPPAPGQQLLGQIRDQKVSLIVINRLYWQVEELAFEKELEGEFRALGYPVTAKTRSFDNVRVIEVDRALLLRPHK